MAGSLRTKLFPPADANDVKPVEASDQWERAGKEGEAARSNAEAARQEVHAGMDEVQEEEEPVSSSRVCKRILVYSEMRMKKRGRRSGGDLEGIGRRGGRGGRGRGRGGMKRGQGWREGRK